MLTQEQIDIIKAQYVQTKLIVDEVEKTGIVTRRMAAILAHWDIIWDAMDDEQCTEIRVINK